MFTVRFMDGGNSSVVCGARYDARHLLTEEMERAACCIVTVYPQVTSDVGGVEFQVGGDRLGGYEVAYVENSAGKTIDRIGPFQ